MKSPNQSRFVVEALEQRILLSAVPIDGGWSEGEDPPLEQSSLVLDLWDNDSVSESGGGDDDLFAHIQPLEASEDVFMEEESSQTSPPLEDFSESRLNEIAGEVGAGNIQNTGESNFSAPFLPGLELSELPADGFDGQVIYLNFGGAGSFDYAGPVTLAGLEQSAFFVPERYLDTGLTKAAVMAAVVDGVQSIFGQAGLTFVTGADPPAGEHSVIFIGGDDAAFREFGHFYGLAEAVDVGNADRSDRAFVFSETIAEATSGADNFVNQLVAVTAHEAGRLLGYSNVPGYGGDGPLAAVASEGAGAAMVPGTDGPERPLLVLPGIAGTFAAPGFETQWFTDRGMGPEGLEIDPLAGFYNDVLVTMQDAAGYTLGLDLFAATYDWRMEPGPAPTDAADFDGVVTGLTAESLTDGVYRYGVDYMGYWMEQAVLAWTEAHGVAPDGVDVIAHSTGGLVARTYIQSTAYNESNGEIVLPEINNLILVGVPNRGASKAWNPLNDNFGGDPAYRTVLSKAMDVAYNDYYLRGITITGADGDLSFDPDDPGAVPLTQLEFIDAYVPTIRALLATYDFLIPEGGTLDDLMSVNDDADQRNRWLLHLNDGLDLDYTLEDFQTGAPAADGRDPHRFIDIIQGQALIIYSEGDDDGFKTALYAEQFTGPNSPTDEVVPFNRFYGGPPAADQVWYVDIKEAFGGDGTVPFMSAAGQFQNDPLNRFADGSAGTGGSAQGYWFNVTDPNTDAEGAPIASSISHTGIMLNIESQTAMLNFLGVAYDPTKISTNQAYTVIDSLVRVIRHGILTPSEILADANLGDLGVDGLNALLRAGFDETVARVEALVPGEFLQSALGFLPVPEVLPDEFDLNDYIRMPNWLNAIFDPVFQFLENDPEATTEQLATLLRNLEVDLGGAEFRVDEDRVLAGVLTDDAQLLAALGGSGSPEIGEALNELFVRVPFVVEQTIQLPVDFGREVERLGIRIDDSLSLEALARFSIELSFGYDLREGLESDERFFLRTPGMQLELEIAVDDISADLNLGIIRSSIEGGSFALGTTLSYALRSPSDNPRGNVTQADLRDHAAADLFALRNEGYLDVNLPIAMPEILLDNPSPGLMAFGLSSDSSSLPTLRISNPDIYQFPDQIELDNFGSLSDFLALTPSVLEDVLDQLGERLGALAVLGDLGERLPFADGVSFWEAIDFGQVIVEDFVQPLRGEDGLLRFKDLDSFIALAADLLGMDPADIGGQYLAGEQELHFTFDFSKVIDLGNQAFAFDESFGPLELGLAGGGFSLSGEAGLTLSLVVDLDLPITVVASENALPVDGQTVDQLIFGLSVFGGEWMTVEVASSVGNSTPEDLVADINAALFAAGLLGRVQAKVGEEDQLVFETRLPSAFPSLGVRGENAAAADLLGWDNERVRTNDPLGRVSLESATADASLQIDAGPISGSGRFGILEVTVENGTADIAVDLEIDLAPGGPVSLATLYALSRSSDPLALDGFALPEVVFGINGGLVLGPVTVNDGLVDDPAAEATIAVTLSLNESGSGPLFDIEVDFDAEFAGLERYAELALSEIYQLLIDLATTIADATGSDLLDRPIPPIDRSFNELVELAQPVLDLIAEIEAADPKTLQEFADVLVEIFFEKIEERVEDGDVDAFLARHFPGLDVEDLVDFSIANDRIEIRFHQIYEIALDASIRLDLADQVPGLENIIDLQGQSEIALTGGVLLEAAVAIDLSDPAGIVFEVLRDTGVEARLGFAAEEIAINAAVGSIGFFIRDGYARLSAEDDSDEAASIRIGLNENGETGGIAISDLMLDDFAIVFDAEVDIELPVFFPTTSVPVVDAETGEPSPIFLRGLLSDPDSFSIGGPNFDDLIAGVTDLMDSFDSGLDVFFFLLDELADGELFGLPIPLIGDQLASAANFISELRTEITTAIALVDAPAETLAEEIGDALFAALGPAGIDLLRSRDDSGAPVREDVVVSLITDAEDVVIEIKIDLPLGQTLDSGLSFDFDLGLPGLPLSLDAAGGLEAALFWEFDLVFGVHRTEGFFIETLPDEDELRLGLEVSIPDIELTGQLGFLLLTAVDNPPDAETPSGLELSLGVDFSPFAGNRVTLETLTSQGFAFVDASFDGGLDLNLAFEVGFAGASAVPVTALPSFLMDFSLSWDFDGTTRTDAQSGTFGSAPDVSFTNARIAVGTFFSDFLGPIADTINGYLGPLKPLIDILQTEIAILDAIPGVRNVLGIPDGTPIDFLALAEAWGDLPPSTRQFIDALDTIIELADMISSGGVPGRDSVLTVPLGDFGFGAIDLRQAGIVQQLTSEQLVSMGEADEAAGSLADRFAALALEGGDGAAAADAFALTSAGASGPGSFDFRLLSLENVIRIISGQAIELFEYTTPEFFFEFDFRLPIPIWTPPLVELFLRADFSARAQLTFGYDSTGFMDWQSSGELSDIFNGFYVRTGDSVPPQLTLAGTIGGGVSVTIPPVRASAEVQLGAEANFNLIGGRDDKLYFRLLADHVAEEGFAALQCYFIVDGRITASFVFTIEDFLFGRSLPGFPLTVGPATLWEFEIAGDDCLCGIAGMDDRLEAVEGGQLNNNAPAIAADIGSAPGIHIEGASISSSNDTDWYTFDVPRADNLRLNLNGPAHLSVSVYDEDLNLIRHNERNNTNKTLNLGLLAAGRYFVHIESRELEPGAYSLSITPAPSSETRVFYVNDGTVDDPTINSYYTLAPGDGTNDGLSPHRPVDSLESLLASGVTLGENDFIVIDSGTYTGTTEFSGDHSGFAIVGAPAVRYVDLPEELVVGSILTAASGTALDLSGTSGVLVDGLAFENVDVAIAASSTSGTRLTDIRIHNADTGILGVGASGIRIDGLEVTASGTAINLDGAAGAIVNDVSITGVNRMGSGIEFVNADNAVLSGITFRDLADGIQIGQSNNLDLSAVQAITVGRAIEISDALTLELANIQLEGGTEVEDEESFIPVYEGRGSTGLRLTDVEDFSLLLIVINRYETALELSGLSNGSIQGTQLRHVGTGIHAETLSELTLQGNTVEATDRGMVLTGMNNDVSLFGNSVFLVPPSEGEPISSTAVAIEIFDTSELSISSNTVFGDVEIDGVSDLFFTGNTTFGGDILMVAATGINFLDNEVNGAVSISGGGALTLRDNTVTGSVSLVAAAGSIVVVEDNSFAGLGINAGEGTLVTVSGNTFTSSGASIVVAGDSEVAVTANDATGGISVTGGELVDVLSNTVNGGGIKVADATNVTLEENTVTVGGGTEALVLDSVTNALLEANTLTGGVLGIEGSAEVLAQNNTLTDSGIRVIESTEVDLLDNSLTGGDLAFLVDQATFVLIAGNVVAGATHGIRIRGENGTPATNVMAELNNLGGAGGSTGTGVRLENTHLESVVIRDNSIDNFGSHGVDASGYGEFHRNTVSNSQVGVRFDPSVAGLWENELFDNVVGLTGTGFLGNDDHAANRHNEIRDNITGILATGDQTVAFNRVSNSTADGIVIVGDDVVVHNNVVFRNAGASILVTDAAADVSIYNNTVYSEADYAVRVEGGASDLDLRNNILWSTGGFVLSVEFGSDIGLTSDYNNLYASGTALLGEWVRTFDDLLDWQIELDLDRHSIGTTRIDPALDQPVFRDLANDDFRIAHSSESGTATTINAGDSTFAFTHEPGPDGGPNGLRVNLGAYGNTAEAALSPEAYIRVLSPNFYTDYNRDLARRVIWEFFNIAGNVALELHQAGEGKVADITTVTIGNQPPEVSEQADSIGSYFWSPGMSGISGDNDARYFIRIVPAQDAALAAQNREAFSVPQASNQYYLNDSDTTTAVLTSAPGDNRHTGLTAATPKASLLAFLENYELSADQTIFVDDGLYLHLREVVISSATSLGNNEAFTIRGPDAGTGVATFDRADARPGTHGILLDDASFVSIRNLSMIGGHEGIVARNNSTFLAIENVELTGHPSAAIRIEDGAIRATLDNVRVFDGGGVGVIVDGRLEAIRNSIFEGNAGRGLSLTDTHDAVIDNNRFTSNAGGGIFARNNVSSTLTVLGNADINAFRGNVFTDNSGDQVNVRGNILVVGNTVLRTPGNEGSGVGIRAWANTLQYNVVSGHATGIWIEQGGTAIGNRVYNNAETGIRLSGNQGRTITENVIYSNPRGIFATNTSGSNTYRNNLIYDASTAAIEHRTTNNAVFHNNTIYQEIGDGIRLVSSTGADIRNNIFDIANGTGLVLDTAGETGITSNYNLFHIAPEATLGTWNGVPRATFTDWRNASFLDANGLAADPLFVNPGGLNGFAGYTDFENDGSDSNFHLQSTAGSPRDAALAPVLSVDAGNRPLFPALSYTVDATISPAIDRGDAALDFSNEPEPNGGFVNIGAFGNTALASLSPDTYVLVKNPQGGETWPIGQSFEIRWRSHDFAGEVDIVLVQGEASAPVFTIADGISNSGSLVWTVDDTITPGTGYRVEITRTDGSGVSGESFTPFTISEAISFFYVNDNTVSVGGFTTAAGDNANDGLDPSRPKASIRAILEAYDLGEGDVILVDSGTYELTTNILLAAADSGVTIRGFINPADPDSVTIIERGSISSGNYIFEMVGASGVTFEDLTLTGAHRAIFADHGGGADITVRNVNFLFNQDAGIHIGRDNPGLIVESSYFEGSRVHNVSGRQSDGIFFNSPSAIIRNNVFVDNYNHAIQLSGSATTEIEYVIENNIISGSRTGINSNVSNALFIGNTVFESVTEGIDVRGSNSIVTASHVYDNNIGIKVASGALAIENLLVYNNGIGIFADFNGGALGNLVYDNNEGIRSRGSGSGVINLIADNEVRDNNTGIRFANRSDIIGNVVYNNGGGLRADSALGNNAQFRGTIINNIVYGNTDYALEMINTTGSPLVHNNTFIQSGAESVTIWLATGATNVDFRNNIVANDGGTALIVSSNSQPGFTADYNLYHLTSAADFVVWGEVAVPTLADWFYELGQDRNARTGDPLFVDAAEGDFRLMAGSPAFAAGDPAFAWVYEAQPSGGRIDIGAFGGTPDSTPGDAYWIEVVDPFSLSKLEQGTPFEIVFQTYGFAEIQAAQWFNGGTATYGRWLPLNSDQGTSLFTNNNTIDRSGVSNPAPESVYQQQRREGFGPGNRMDFTLDLPQGDYVIRLHMATVNSTAATVYDILIDDVVVREAFDLLAAAGGAANTAVVEEVLVSVGANGTVTIGFDVIDRYAYLGGIEVLPVIPTGLSNPTFTVEASFDGGATFAPVATGVTVDNAGVGRLMWTPDVATVGADAVLRVVSENVPEESATSAPFLIANDGNVYYINNSSTANAVHSSEIGDNANSGKTPDAPMASLRALLSAYTLSPGDIVYIDSGTYTFNTNLILDAGMSGVTIIGAYDPDNADAVTTFDRDNRSSGTSIFRFEGAADVTIEHITFTGAHRAIYTTSGGAENLTVRNASFLFNQDAGIYVDRLNSGFLVEDSYFEGSRVFNTPGRQSDAIYYNGASAVIRNNVFVDNYDTAINISGFGTVELEYLIEGNTISGSRTGINSNVSDALFTGNTVFESVTEGIDVRGSNSIVTASHVYDNNIGIKVASGALAIENLLVYNNGIGIFADFNGGALGNLVFDNNEGIRSRGSGSGVINLIADNEVRDNNTGIRFANRSDIIGNVVYNNGGGLRADSALGNNAQFRGTIINNLVYGNTLYALEMINTTGSPIVHNNTFVQAGAESMTIWLSNGAVNVDFRNNIVVSDGGTALVISENSQPDFSADYNLYHLLNGASFAEWGDLGIETAADWFYEIGFGFNSRFGDPLFVDPATGDFRISPASPAFAGGDPETLWVYQTTPSGGRVEIGAFGGSSDAAAGDDYALSFLSPNDLSKLLQNEAAWIEFFTFGFTAGQSSQWFNAGTSHLGKWHSLNSDQGTSNVNNSNAIDLSGVLNPAPESVYQQQRREGFGPGNRMDFTLDLPEGDYVLRLHMATENNTNATVFDILVDGVVVRGGYDLLAAAGGAASTAVVEEIAVSVGADGVVTVGFDVIERYAYLAAIEVVSVNANPVAPDPTFSVEASLDGGLTFETIATGLSVDLRGVGGFEWTPTGFTAGADAVLRVISDDLTEQFAVSDPFLIANDGNIYYVNNDSLVNGVHTVAIGNNANSGKSPDAPMASLGALFNAYSPSAGDIIYIDSGTYSVSREIVLTAAESGVTIIGAFDPENAEAVTTLDRGNLSSGSHILRLEGVEDLTVEHITFTGAHRAIFADEGGAPGLTVRHAAFIENQDAGIRIERFNPGITIEDSYFRGIAAFGAAGRQTEGVHLNVESAVIRNNTFVDNYDTGLFIRGWAVANEEYLIENNFFSGSRTGLEVQVSNAWITGNIITGTVREGAVISGNSTFIDNDVFDNEMTGIEGRNNAQIVENRVHGNSLGIFINSGNGQFSTALRNLVFLNSSGIDLSSSSSSGSAIAEGNRVYGNDNFGIRLSRLSQAIGNHVYSNDTGIHARAEGSNQSARLFRGAIENNLVYANESIGIRIDISTTTFRLANNTVYQATGEALRLNEMGGGRILNNILWVDAGFAVTVASGSEGQFEMDYNLFFLSPDPNARIGEWGSTFLDTLEDWQQGTGLDANSRFGDPLFFDSSGADDVLGYREVSGVFIDGGVDDNFHLLKFSPAIDAGSTWWAPGTDLEGDPRLDDPGVPNAGDTRYVHTVLEESLFDAERGQAQGWNFWNGTRTLELPFLFPFYDAVYDSVEVTSRGFLNFENTFSSNNNSSSELAARRLLAVLWDDINTGSGDGRDIFVDTSVAGEVYIRWEARFSDNSLVQVAVLLREDGSIRFDYGEGNLGGSPTVGHSFGNRINFTLIDGFDGMDNLANAFSVEIARAAGIVDIGAFEFKGDSSDDTPPVTLETIPPEIEAEGFVFAAIDSIVVRFSEPIDSIDASSAAAYELILDSDGDGLFTDADTFFDLAASYDSEMASVTLTVLEGLLPSGDYRLRIFASNLRDVSGNPLDGDSSGEPGGDYIREFTIGQPVLSQIISPAEAEGVRGESFSYQIEATESPLAFGAEGLPDGLFMNTETGLIFGSPTESGLFEVTLSVTNSDGTTTAPLALTILDVPGVLASFINEGAAQRSMVNAVRIELDADFSAALADADVRIFDRVAGVWRDDISLTLDWDFFLSSIVVTFPTLPGGSLPDGIFTLVLDGASIESAEGIALDGNGDGTTGGELAVDLHRFFGDSTANGIIDNLDAARFRAAFGTSAGDPGYNPIFDAEGTGTVDLDDRARFLANRSEPLDFDALFSYDAPALPSITATEVNDGEIQRSMVTDLTLTFDRVAEGAVDPAEFRLFNRTTGERIDPADMAVTWENEGRTARLAFSALPAASLGDGFYSLVIDGERTAIDELLLDGEGSGEAGSVFRFDFHRLFGDSTGNGAIDNLDAARFRNSLGSEIGDTAYHSYFDFDANGMIGTVDRDAFSANHGEAIDSEALAPLILREPTPAVTASLGGSAQFSVFFASPAPVTFNWYRGDTLIASGSSLSTLLLEDLEEEDFATYRVELANTFGAITSLSATLLASEL